MKVTIDIEIEIPDIPSTLRGETGQVFALGFFSEKEIDKLAVIWVKKFKECARQSKLCMEEQNEE